MKKLIHKFIELSISKENTYYEDSKGNITHEMVG